MKRLKKPDITPERLGVNPFLNETIIAANEVYFDGQLENREGSGYFPYPKVIEATAYTKFYHNKDMKERVNNLSDRGARLLLWIMQNIESNEDYIWLNYERYMYERGIKSYNTYDVARVELGRGGIIKNSGIKGVYFINPNIFFRGDRIKSFPNNLKIRKSKKTFLDG